MSVEVAARVNAVAEPSIEATKRRPVMAHWVYSLLLFLLTLLFFAKPLMQGHLSMPLDVLGFVYPWSEHSASTFKEARQEGPQNGLLVDQINLILPSLHFAREQLRDGHVPLWGTSEMGGAPFLANDQSAVFYLPNLLIYLFPMAVGLQAFWMLKPFGAGLGMYFFLCSINVRRPAAFTGAVAFMFSSFFVVWLGWSLTSTAMWLPWSFLYVEKLLQSEREKRARWIAALAIVTGMHLLSGHIETSFHILLALGIYTLWRVGGIDWMRGRLTGIRAILSQLLFAGAGVGIGIALAAVQLLPTEIYLKQSYFYSIRINSLPWRLPISYLSTWLVPNLTGNSAYYQKGLDPAQFTNFNERMGYAGIVTIALAVVAFVHPSPALRVHRWAFAVLMVLSTCLVYGIWPIYLLEAKVPILNVANNLRLTLVISFALAALAAIGMDGLVERAESGGTWQSVDQFKSPTLIELPLVMCAALFAFGAAFISKDQTLSLIQRLAYSYTPVTMTMWAQVWTMLALALVVACAITVMLFQSRVIDPHVGVLAITLLVIGDMFVFGVTYNPSVPTSYLYPDTEVTQIFRSLPSEARIAAPPDFQSGFAPWFDLRVIGAYDAIMPARVPHFLDAINRNGSNPNSVISLATNTTPDYHLLAVGHVTHALLPTAAVEPPGTNQHFVFEQNTEADKAMLEIGVNKVVTQEFVVHENYLDSVSFFAAATSGSGSASLSFGLTDVTTGTTIVTQDEHSDIPAAGAWLTFSFPPLPASAGQRYRASLSLTGNAPQSSTIMLYGNGQTIMANTRILQSGRQVPGTLRIRLSVAADKDGLTAIWHDDSHTLYVLNDARPYVYIADGILPVADSEMALTTLDQLHVPGADAVIETSQSLSSAGGIAKVLHNRPGDVIVQVNASASGVLVLNEGYGDGGWQVDIDGKSAKVLNANYLYQGAAIPAGEHIVHFQYAPKSFTIGAVISTISGIGILALLIIPSLIRRTKRKKTESTSRVDSTA